MPGYTISDVAGSDTFQYGTLTLATDTELLAYGAIYANGGKGRHNSGYTYKIGGSGGGVLGFYHLGVVKTLMQQGLLPPVDRALAGEARAGSRAHRRGQPAPRDQEREGR